LKFLPALLLALGTLTACSSMPVPTTQVSAPGQTQTPQPEQTPESPPIPVPTPIPPVPSPPPPPPPPAQPPKNDLEAPLIRVLLSGRKSDIVLPGTGRPWLATSEGRKRWLWGPLKISISDSGTWWQTGAFQSPEGAAEMVEKLKAALGPDLEIRQRKGNDGLIRVLVLHGPDGKDFLADAGFPGAFRSAAPTSKLRIETAQEVFESSEEILLNAAGEEFIRFGDARYRGRMIVRNGKGKILLINELNLEAYLHGVVPAEMGPSAFPALEALKAQAVAARTYAIAHLGDHRDSGYDICATPACQVYGGAGVEHRLTDRAVEETTGIIATYDEKPINAMYTSTCGGHTEDVNLLFWGEALPYLRGVPCSAGTPLRLRGTDGPGDWMNGNEFRALLTRKILGLRDDAAPSDMLRAMALEFEVTAPPAARRLEEYTAGLLELTGLEGPAEHLGPAKDAVGRLLDMADLYGVLLDPPTAAGWMNGWDAEAALAVLEITGRLRQSTGILLRTPEGHAAFSQKSSDPPDELPEVLPLWERWNHAYRNRRDAEIHPGDHLISYTLGERPIALVFLSTGGAGEADRRSAWRDWIRERSWKELARRMKMPTLNSLEITKRSPSGRVIGLRARDASGRSREWKGFEIRRILDLPETLFDFIKITDEHGEKILRFFGRGWGHGVGLCQNGAYGMARAGRTYDEILRHYYQGIRLESMP